MKYRIIENIKELIKKINNIMDDTPLPFDNKSAKYYRTKGEEFRNQIKVNADKENETMIKKNQTGNLTKGTKIQDDIMLK